LGGDGGLTIGLDDPKSLIISIPVSQVRAGYYFSDVLSFEPSLGFFSATSKGSQAFSQWTVGLGVKYDLAADRKLQRLFVHPFLTFTGGSGGQDTQTGLGAGIGFMKPAMGDRFQWRLEGGLQHRLKSGPIPSSTGIYARAGVSIFTK